MTFFPVKTSHIFFAPPSISGRKFAMKRAIQSHINAITTQAVKSYDQLVNQSVTNS